MDKKDETLISPLSSLQRKQDNAEYNKITLNVPLFHDLNDMSVPVNPAWLDEGAGIETALIRNKERYDNSCRLLFNNTKLRRTCKRAVSPSTSGTEEKCGKIQRSFDDPEVQCFLCEKVDEISKYRRAMTMQLT